jgi:hypothetical protein
MKIIVITLPRTASNWYCSQLATQHDIKNYNERLTDILHKKQSIRVLTNLIKELIQVDSGVFNLKLCHWEDAEDYSSKSKQLHEFITSADQIYYLYRQDKEAQIRSLICAERVDNWFGDVVDNSAIELNVSSDHFKLYQEKHETCTRQVLDCQNQYPGLTVYTENIIAGNEQPYKQKYNLNII